MCRKVSTGDWDVETGVESFKWVEGDSNEVKVLIEDLRSSGCRYDKKRESRRVAR